MNDEENLLNKKNDLHLLTSGVISDNNFHTGFPSNLPQRSHNALIRALTAKWTTPFSGPNCKF